MLGIALPADHPLWTAAEEPLPVEAGDVLRAVRAPGWLVSGTRGDGIVRVVNHGTDHAVEGSMVSDSPLYARLGYSTVTSPVLDESGWETPVDQTVALVDATGRVSHRAGMRTQVVATHSTEDGVLVGVAASVADAHWVVPEPGQRDHGSGRAGRATAAGRIATLSLVRGAWEVRLVRVDELAAESETLRVGGWPINGDGAELLRPGSACVSRTGPADAPALRSSATALVPDDAAPGVTTRPDGGPLGGPVRVPWLDFPAREGAWVATLIELTGVAAGSPSAAAVSVGEKGADLAVRVTWPDGVVAEVDIESYGSAVPVVR
jgi:hypothetical protein